MQFFSDLSNIQVLLLFAEHSSDYPCWLYFYAIVAKSKARRGYNKYVCKDSSLRDKQRIQKQSVSSSLLNSIWVRNTWVQLAPRELENRGSHVFEPILR